MNTVTQVSVAAQQLIDSARNNAAEKNGETASAERNYAVTLNGNFIPDWFEFEANDISDEGKIVKAEKEKFYAALHKSHHKGKHPNTSTVWARVRKHGREAQYGVEDTPSAKHVNSPDVRIMNDLVPLYKFLKRQDSLSDKQSLVLLKVGQALSDGMGMDLNLIESGK
jgi:hypothetical protein